MQVAVVMQACLLPLVGPTVWQSALLGLKTFSQCRVLHYLDKLYNASSGAASVLPSMTICQHFF